MKTSSFGMNQSLQEIWPQLQQLDPNVQIIGGYGLYLKQTWLRDSLGAVTHFIPMTQWTGESIPRTTKDMDVGVSPSLIANPGKQGELAEVQATIAQYENCLETMREKETYLEEQIQLEEFKVVNEMLRERDMTMEDLKEMLSSGTGDSLSA